VGILKKRQELSKKWYKMDKKALKLAKISQK